LKAVRLVQYQGGDLARQLQGQAGGTKGWWNAKAASWVGAIAGSICGLLCGLIGLLTGLGKARRFVLVLTAAMTVFGAVCLIVGIVAVSLRQPYEVYYPLLLVGVILVAVCGSNIRSLRLRYEQIELRKMAAMDAR
jgi:hypothetical protein